MKKLYFFRHGETNWNKIDRIQGNLDTELSENGILQAKQNAIFLSDKNIQIIYSSPLKRAFITAKCLADKINVKIIKDDRLKEMNAGDFSGIFKQELIERFGIKNYEDFCHSRNNNLDLSYPNGETRKQMRKRFVECINDVCNNSVEDIIAISSHGHILREFAREMGFEDDKKLNNCECLEAEFNNGNIKIIKKLSFSNN